ncbi:hypothetical protein SLNWT_6959 [Streptomyces albus]|uniref:Uncharacterized protein n=1 Tax=Streptomyces albus (strain ATCC 21838 / DSM 41398 / FERM P-419 / JCM 4703 / NBRC 107858) TaxID=1081613 RepID=A0A0B5F707_STRA4|nr:hypothetical protein SLNWT_6959 [Streptomyces albus]
MRPTRLSGQPVAHCAVADGAVSAEGPEVVVHRLRQLGLRQPRFTEGLRQVPVRFHAFKIARYQERSAGEGAEFPVARTVRRSESSSRVVTTRR